MHANEGYAHTVRDSALEAGTKISCCPGDPIPRQYCAWLFSRTLYQVSYPHPKVQIPTELRLGSITSPCSHAVAPINTKEQRRDKRPLIWGLHLTWYTHSKLHNIQLHSVAGPEGQKPYRYWGNRQYLQNFKPWFVVRLSETSEVNLTTRC